MSEIRSRSKYPYWMNVLASKGIGYWLLIATLVSVFVLRRVFAEGMFLDGVIYAVLSRNLAEGIGSAWSPHFSETLFPIFSEHPPLAFWLQSLTFRVFGDSLYVEKFYSLATLVVCSGIIGAIWVRLVKESSIPTRFLWLPLLLWISNGSVAWAHTNNLLENTLTIFTTLAVYLIILACETQSRLWQAALSISAGIAVCAAALTKGPVALFPLAAFGCYWIAIGKIRFGISLLNTAVMLSIVIAFFATLFVMPDSKEALLRYLDAQLVASLTGGRGGVGGLDKLRAFAGAVGTPVLIASLILIAGWLKGLRPADDQVRRKALFLALVAFSGSIPIFVSPRVTGLYFNPSIPFFALSLSLLVSPVVVQLESITTHRTRRFFLLAGALGLALTFGHAATRIGTDGRDRELLRDVRSVALLTNLRPGTDHWSSVAICPDNWKFWELHAYLARHYKTSLRNGDKTDKHLISQRICPSLDLTNFVDATPQNTKLGWYIHQN